MRQTNEKVYRCDFCNKAMVSAGFMKVHERMCKKNPNNKHQCFRYCENLVKEQFDIKNEYGQCGGSNVVFTCKKRPDIELYSYKLERYKSNQKRLEEMERMPLKCDFYKAEQGHDFSDSVDLLDQLNSEFTLNK